MQPHPPLSIRDKNGPAAQFSWVGISLFAMVLVHGFISGLRTVADFDLGWQMAEARGPLSSTDALSYTAYGAPWIYPRLAGSIFRHLFLLGGYAAISWFCACALVAALAVLAWRSGIPTLLLLLAAVPALATQMIPRSSLFTVVLASAFARLLLAWYRQGNILSLLPLPVLMALWVNLHTGFIAGIGLIAGYAMVERVDVLAGSNAAAARLRLRRAAPWLVATLLSTLANPWEMRIYRMIASQEHISKTQTAIVAELGPLYLHFLSSTLNPLAPESAIWWMLAVTLIAIVLLLRQRRIGLALLLATAAVVCLLSARTQGVFLPLACLIAGDALCKSPVALKAIRSTSPAWRYVAGAGMAALFCLVAVRCVDVVRDRASLREERITLFGAGASWWLPQQAAAFIELNHLPPQLFSTFNLSSYLTWQLAPAYKDFADGRYLPFGDELVSEQQMLASLPLDDLEWRQAAARYGLRTVIFPLSRFFGIEGIPLLQDCLSRDWAPVYLDSQAVIFVRADALPEQRLVPLRLNCQSYVIPQRSGSLGNWRERMEHYQELANSAVIYLMLGRIADAQKMVDAAGLLTQEDPSLPLIQAQIAMADGDQGAAERCLRRSLSMRASSAAWYQLGMLYARERRYPEAVVAIDRSAWLAAPHNFQMKLTLAKLRILDGKEHQALATLEGALKSVPHIGTAGAAERASVFEIEAAAYAQLGDWPNAISAQQDAVRETPTVASRWRALAAMYAATGDALEAGNATARAEQLSARADSR